MATLTQVFLAFANLGENKPNFYRNFYGFNDNLKTTANKMYFLLYYT